MLADGLSQGEMMDTSEPGGSAPKTLQGEMMDTSEPGGSAPKTPTKKKIFRSFFTKKLERKFEEKELGVPQQLLSLMDVPFEEFTPEDKEIYKSKIKPLAFVFAEHLMEVYVVMGRPRRGWEEMLDRIEPSPIKVLATLVIYEDQKAQQLEEEPDPAEVAPIVSSPTDKISVRAYKENDQDKERWWEKKIF